MISQKELSINLVRISLAIGFLSAVTGRLGFWSQNFTLSWGKFLNYCAEVNSFLPKFTISGIAILATILETSFGLCLLFNFKTKEVAFLSSILTLLFALAMAISYGIKEPLDYSVFVFSSASFLLYNLKKN